MKYSTDISLLLPLKSALISGEVLEMVTICAQTPLRTYDLGLVQRKLWPAAVRYWLSPRPDLTGSQWFLHLF